MLLKYHTEKESIVFLSTTIALLATLIGPIVVMGLSIISVIISLIVTLIVFYFLSIFVMAPNNVNFTFIEEGTAKRIYRGGTFVSAILVFLDHVLDSRFKVRNATDCEDGPGFFPRYFGIHFIGLWPLYRIPFRKFTWTSTNEEGEDLTRTEEMDYILVRPDIYSSTLKKAEDKDNMPIAWGFSVVLEIVDIAAATKVQNPFQIVFARIWSYLRDETRRQSYDELVATSGCFSDNSSGGTKIKSALSEKMMRDWEEGGMLDDLIKTCGIKLSKLNIKNMDPDENYRKLTTKKITAEKEKVVTEIGARASAYKLAQEITGTAVEMTASQRGVNTGELREIKEKQPEVFQEKYGKDYENNLAIVVTLRKAELGRYFQFETNATGELGSLASIIAVGKMMADQAAPNKSSGSSSKKAQPDSESKRKKELLKKAGVVVEEDDDD
ncbi:MAG TPA: hypothetical protein PLD14_00950 [Candidatus Pacearchaeota archaeon]|nr:hypothetical protein [Candidatus Pacearchaeota archaeon]HPR79767.1 hypothetical protein [Candidatus Pacearchaeota archaeon]